MRNVAVSGDGRWSSATDYLHSLALFDADRNLVRTYEARHARRQGELARLRV